MPLELDSVRETGSGDLLTRVGTRVRAARRAAKLSRRSLSEQSGVSQRYLAQLEAGGGNISIALLDRVAGALGLHLTHLCAPDGQPDDVAELFARASSQTQADVLRLLGAPVRDRAARLCLIGLRGAGKSTLGARLGAALDVEFVELNQVIEALAGMNVAEIMALYGPDGYRRLEADALEHVRANHSRVILAAAGGIVEDQSGFARLKAGFHTIWLRASPQDHMERVLAQGDTRPMAGNPTAMADLMAILTSREARYAEADAQLNTSDSDPEHTLTALTSLVLDRAIL